MIRKMYDAAPADAGGAAPAVAEPLSVAAQMAKSGRRSDTPGFGSADAPPAPTTPKAAAPAPPAPLPGETPKPAPPASEPAKPAVKSDPPPAAPPKTETPLVEKSWQEVLKSQPATAVFKELGLSDKQVKLLETIKADPKMEKFFDHWSNKGDVTAYLKAATVDFAKMKPEEIMKHDLQERNPEMSAEELNDLYDIKVIDRYKLDPERFSESEVKRGRIELAADVKEHREALVKRQQEFLLSAAPEQATDATAQILAYKEGEQQEAAATKAVYEKHMNEDTFVKNILSSKNITYGEGDEAFKYAVDDPQELMGLLMDNDKFATKMFKSGTDGKGDLIPNTEKQLLVATVLHDDNFLQKFATHHQSIGANKQLAEIENASKSSGTSSKTDAVPDSPAAAMAKSGRIVTGGQ